MDKELLTLFERAKKENAIPDTLYHTYNVKKGLRNEDGTGVLIGLTRIADVVGYQRDAHGQKVNCKGELYYRGYPIETLYESVHQGKLHGFEEICFLILFGHLPNEKEDQLFRKAIADQYELPEGFMASNILRTPAMNIMNKMQRSLLMLYDTDQNADDASPENTLAQGISILAKLPSMMVYAYQAKAHFLEDKSMVIRHVRKDYTIAENILSLLREDGSFTKEEARILDLALILHADHGSGNNSTFSNLVVASTGTDLYSSFAASVGSLKGPKHGGANLTCKRMMDAVIQEVGVDASKDQIRTVVEKILNQQFFDKSGLIYGLGHAVYTISDPRCELLKSQARTLAKEKGKETTLDFYETFEEIAKEELEKRKGMRPCANVDFYSGLIYSILQIPEDCFSPLFVCSRSVGWLAHNIEEKLYSDKIIRPAGLYVGKKVDE